MFDIIGDLHGCFDELEILINRLGYIQTNNHLIHPIGRQLFFIGDYIDRGPRCLDALDFMMRFSCLGVRGNHDDKLRRALLGNKVMMPHGVGKDSFSKSDLLE